MTDTFTPRLLDLVDQNWQLDAEAERELALEPGEVPEWLESLSDSDDVRLAECNFQHT